MKYRDILGYSKSKKKVVKEQSKSKKTTVLDEIKQELNEWGHQPPTTKRWSKSLDGSTGLTEHERQLKEVGAAAEYRKYSKKIDKTRDLFGREVLKFYDLLRKKGLDDAADELLNNYKNSIIKFGKEIKEMIRKMI